MATYDWAAPQDGPVRLHFSAEGHYDITVTTGPGIVRATVAIAMPDSKADQLTVDSESSLSTFFRLPKVTSPNGGTTIIGNGGSMIVSRGGHVSTVSGRGNITVVDGQTFVDGVRLQQRDEGVHIESDKPVYVNGKLMVPADGSAAPQDADLDPRKITVVVGLPAGSSIVSRAAAGDFVSRSVDKAALTEVDASTGQGDVRVDYVDELSAESGQGCVVAASIGDGTLVTGQGNVHVASWTGSGSARSGQGNVTVDYLTGSRVQLSTGMGNVTVHGGGAGSARCRSGMGDVRVTKEAGSEFTAEARSGLGRVSNGATV
jgi:hypothetical protein